MPQIGVHLQAWNSSGAREAGQVGWLLARRSFLGLAVALLLSAGVVAGPRAPDQIRYAMPRSLELALAPASGALQIEARLESRCGLLTDLELFVTTSPDLRCNWTMQRLSELRPGRPVHLTLPLARTASGAGELGSWVRLGVRYIPDYEALRAAVADPASFPIEAERRRLPGILARSQKSRARFTDATRLFLPRP
jgi:hypothetical protein